MLWKLFTTTKFGRRVSVPFESLTPNRLDATTEAQARYGHTNVTLHPDIRSDGNNIVSGSYDKTIKIWKIGYLIKRKYVLLNFITKNYENEYDHYIIQKILKSLINKK